MTETTGFEIDFLPVGNGDRSGDAIAIRYGTSGNYKVLVYDGGTKESGQALVDHIKKYYGTSRVDYMVNSHPDADHASGLSVIMEQMEVGELWMHQPWQYSDVILNYFKDGRITDSSLAEQLKEKMAAAYALEKLAEANGIPVYAPYQGAKIGDFIVLSPEINWYVHELIAEFAKSPEQKKAEEVAARTEGLLGTMTKAAAAVAAWVTEHWGFETLRDDVQTSAENESSVVLFGHLGGKGILLTGDAGIRALTATAEYTELKGVSLPEILNYVQIPHHGSRNNVSTNTLDRIIGSRKTSDDGISTKIAYVSASKESSTHPRKIVINAFIRRGTKVIATQGQLVCQRHNMPMREGWVSATPLDFSTQVESWS
ncbi:MAG: competence protein ComEC [Desulfobulbus sp.]|nr:competence protein ComEC [Desulfobulbus sp.]